MKKILWVVLVGIVILGVYVFNQRQTGQITGTEEQKAEKLAQIISSGGSAACKVTDLTDNSVIEYVLSGKKMKVFGMSSGEGKRGAMINDGIYIYSWNEGETSGFKMKLPTEEEMAKTTETTKKYEQYDAEKNAAVYDDETKFKMECTKRIVSDSEFSPPTGVNFVDPTQIQNMTPDQIRKMMPAPEE